MELSKQETELFKQEMELFRPLPDLWSKSLFYQMSLIFTKELYIYLWQIQKNSGKIVLKNISDGFMTDSKNLSKIVWQNIPDSFAID